MLSIALVWSLAQVPEPPAPADEIRWTAPPGCPGREALIAGIERRRGRPLAPGAVRVDATVRAGPGRRFFLIIGLGVGGREERRSVSGESCAALVDAAALLVALAIDEEAARVPAGGGEVASEASEVVGEVASDAVASEAGDGVASEAAGTEEVGEGEVLRPGPIGEVSSESAGTPVRARARVGGVVRGLGGLEVGALPGVSGAVSLGFGVLWRRVRLELVPTFVAPRSGTAAGVELRAWLATFAALGCGRFGRGAVELPVCGGLEVGWMRAVVRGADGERVVPGGWVAGVLGAGVVWRVRPRLGLMMAVQGVLALRRPGYQLRDPGPAIEVFEPSAVSLRVLAGIEVGLGDPR